MEGKRTMTEAMILAEVAPAALERARRLEYAIKLVREGHDRRKVSGAVFVRFSVSRSSAWRIADMAIDMAGEIK